MKKGFSFYICTLILGFSLVFSPVHKAKALFGVGDTVFDPATWTQSLFNAVSAKVSEAVDTYTKNLTDKDWWQKQWEKIVLPGLKRIAINKINDQTTAYVTGGNAGKPFLVTDWNQYLIKGPADEAMVYVNSLLNNSLRGRGSAANYSNSGNASYLQKQVAGTLNPPTLNIAVSSSGDWRAGMFREGNMKNFNTFLATGNNPYSLSVIAADTLAKKTAENQLVADREQVKGYIPQKDALGRIKTPAAVFENAVNSASNMANDLLVDVIPSGEVWAAVQNFAVQASMKNLKEGFIKIGSTDGVVQLTAGVNTINSGIDTTNSIINTGNNLMNNLNQNPGSGDIGT